MGKGWSLALGALGGLNAFGALENVVSSYSTRTALLQYHLSKAPELTDQVLKAAHEAAKISSVSLGVATLQAVLAGYFFVRAYHEFKKE